MSTAAAPPNWRRAASCLAGGAVLSLAFPPAGIWPVAFLGLIPLLFVLRRAGPAAAALYGLLFGVGFFGATLYWILRFGAVAWTSLTLLSAAFIALFAVLAAAGTRPSQRWRTLVAVAAAWTAVEFLRGAWPLGGFTWGTLGVSQADDRLLLPLASITGVWGVSFVVAAVNAALLEAWIAARRRAPTRAIVLPGLVAVALLVAPVAIAFPSAEGPSVDVATLQVDVRDAGSLPGEDEDLAIARMHLELHRSLAGRPPDLVVWGEGALDPAAARDANTAAAVREAIGTVGVPAIVGAVSDDADGRQRTTVLGYGEDGELVDRYDKVHLVPYGEYVPFRARLGWLEAIRQIPVDRAPGEGVGLIELPGLPAVGAPICFENSFPALTRAFVARGAGFLVVPVNNASYGSTAASEQHLQMSRIRAVENGRWVVNAAISGVSAFIAPDGTVASRTELFATDILRGSVRTSTAMTPYARWGDWFPWVSVVIVVGALARPKKRTVPSSASLDALPSRPRTLVILPTFDERATIEQVVRGVLDRPDDVSILVVDDSSPDGTAEVVRAIAATDGRVRLHERPAKSGLASAYLTGFWLALAEGFDLIVEMDSDLSHDPTELGRLLAGASEAGLVIGSRYVAGGSVTNWSKLRLALSRGGNIYARFMLGLPVHDATSGFRVYRREVLRRLLEEPIASDGYGFQVELALRAWRLGVPVAEVPITFREREHGASKISRRIVVEALWLITKWGLAARLRPAPDDVPEPSSAR